jgi:hypothetical protein
MRGVALALLLLCVGAGIQAQGILRPSTLALAAAAGSVTASWDPNPVADQVVTYRLYYGTAPSTYTATPIDIAAPATSVVVPNLTPGQMYYFALQARAAVFISALSLEVSGQVPMGPDPTCLFPLGANAIRITPTLLTRTGSGGPGSATRLDYQVASPQSPVTSVGVYSNGVAFLPQPGATNPMTGPNQGGIAGQWFLFPTVTGTYPVTIVASNQYGCSQSFLTSYVLAVP